MTIENYTKPAAAGSGQDIFGRKAFECMNLGLYNVEICGEPNGLRFELKRFDIRKKLSIKDIVRKKKLVFVLKSGFFTVNINCVCCMC